MGGVVPKKFRLFKGQQVIFFNKCGDSPLKERIGKIDARDQYFVEGFDQDSFPASGRHRRQPQGGDLGRIAHYPAHFADHRVEKTHLARDEVLLCRSDFLKNQFAQDFRRMVVVLRGVYHFTGATSQLA